MRTLLKWLYREHDHRVVGDGEDIYEEKSFTDKELADKCYITGKEYEILYGCDYGMNHFLHADDDLNRHTRDAGHCHNGKVHFQKMHDGKKYKIEAWLEDELNKETNLKVYPGKNLIKAVLAYERHLDEKSFHSIRWPSLTLRMNLEPLGYNVYHKHISAHRLIAPGKHLVIVDERKGCAYEHFITMMVVESLRNVQIDIDGIKAQRWRFFAKLLNPSLRKSEKDPHDEKKIIDLVMSFEKQLDENCEELGTTKKELDGYKSQELMRKLKEE